MIRGLAIDLDGTLLQRDGTPRPRAIAALTAASAAGIHVRVASARWAALAARVTRQIPGSRIIIACSGGQVLDLESGRDIFDARIPASFTRWAMELCNEYNGSGTFALESDVLVRLPQAREMNPAAPEVHYVTHLEAAGTPGARVIMIQPGDVVEAIRADGLGRWASDVHMVDALTSGGRTLLTITAASAHKGIALRAACDHFGITTDEVVAFGDSGNDIALFEAAGYSVAMGNGTPEAKAAATMVTVPNTEDGVAVIVERILATGGID